MIKKSSRISIVLLSLLEKQSSTGYDISLFFRESGLKWSHQQCYRELGQLKQQGFVDYKIKPQDNKPDKKIYSITKTGKTHLTELKQQSEDFVPLRDELMVYAVIGDNEKIEHHQSKLIERLNQIPTEREKSFKLPDDLGKTKRLVLSREQALLNADLSWIEQLSCNSASPSYA